MNPVKTIVLSSMAGLAVIAAAIPAGAETTVRVGWCARTLSSAAAPYAIATKLGWYASEGIAVQPVPLPGSGDCVKFVATREIPAALASIEPVPGFLAQGVKLRVYYTAYQGNVYGIAVPRDSTVRTVADLRGKRIGLISFASAGLPVARALVSQAGMDPDKDVQLVVAGEGAQTAAMLRGGQVDALSQFDTQYALVENAGVPLRMLDTKEIDRYPSNGFVVLEETFATMKKELVAVARGYAKGTIFAINNPEAAIRILWEVYPQTKPTGKDEATALRDDVKTLEARAVNWRMTKSGAKRWGENVEANFDAYLAFLLKYGVIKNAVPAKDVVTNAWIDEINNFDPKQIAAQAKAYVYK